MAKEMTIDEIQQSLLGAEASPPDHRDWTAKQLFAAVEQGVPMVDKLPQKTNRKMLLDPIRQKGPTCVGESTGLAFNFMERADQFRSVKFDGEDLYGRCKLVDGIPRMPGTYPRVAFNIAKNEGVKVKGKSEHYKIEAYYRAQTLNDIKKALYMHNSAVLLAMNWAESWCYHDRLEEVEDRGRMRYRFPKPDGTVGGHQIFALNYDDKLGALELVQTWGGNFGEGGLVLMPYEYIDFTEAEAWVLTDERTGQS